jgi:hypothetical protein
MPDVKFTIDASQAEAGARRVSNALDGITKRTLALDGAFRSLGPRGNTGRVTQQLSTNMTKVSRSAERAQTGLQKYARRVNDVGRASQTASVAMTGVADKIAAVSRTSALALGPLSGVGSRLNAIAAAIRGGGLLGAAAVAGGVGVGVGLFGLGKLANDASVEIDELNKKARQLGTTLNSLRRIEFLGERFGVEDLTQGLERFQNRLAQAVAGRGQGRFAFEGLDVQPELLIGRGFENQLLALSEAFEKVEGPALSTSRAIELFGRAGADVLRLLQGGPELIREEIAAYDALGLTLDASAGPAAEAYRNNVTALQTTLKGIQFDIGVALIPTLETLVGLLSEGAQNLKVFTRGLDGKGVDALTEDLRDLNAELVLLQSIESDSLLADFLTDPKEQLQEFIDLYYNEFLRLFSGIGLGGKARFLFVPEPVPVIRPGAEDIQAEIRRIEGLKTQLELQAEFVKVNADVEGAQRRILSLRESDLASQKLVNAAIDGVINSLKQKNELIGKEGEELAGLQARQTALNAARAAEPDLIEKGNAALTKRLDLAEEEGRRGAREKNRLDEEARIDDIILKNTREQFKRDAAARKKALAEQQRAEKAAADERARIIERTNDRIALGLSEAFVSAFDVGREEAFDFFEFLSDLARTTAEEVTKLLIFDPLVSSATSGLRSLFSGGAAAAAGGTAQLAQAGGLPSASQAVGIAGSQAAQGASVGAAGAGLGATATVAGLGAIAAVAIGSLLKSPGSFFDRGGQTNLGARIITDITVLGIAAEISSAVKNRPGRTKFFPQITEGEPTAFDERLGLRELEGGFVLSATEASKRLRNTVTKILDGTEVFINSILRAGTEAQNADFLTQLIPNIAGFTGRSPSGRQLQRTPRSIAESAVLAFGGTTEFLGEGRKFKEEEARAFDEFLSFATALPLALDELRGSSTDFASSLLELNRQFAQTIGAAERFGIATEDIRDAFAQAEQNLRDTLTLDVETQLLGALDPLAAALVQFEVETGAARLREAKAAGLELASFEALNAQQRQQIFDQQSAPIRNALDQINIGDLGQLPISERLANAREAFELAQESGDLGRISSTGLSLLDLSRSAFGSGTPFAQDRELITGVFDQLLSSFDPNQPFGGLIGSVDSVGTILEDVIGGKLDELIEAVVDLKEEQELLNTTAGVAP